MLDVFYASASGRRLDDALVEDMEKIAGGNGKEGNLLESTESSLNEASAAVSGSSSKAALGPSKQGSKLEQELLAIKEEMASMKEEIAFAKEMKEQIASIEGMLKTLVEQKATDDVE